MASKSFTVNNSNGRFTLTLTLTEGAAIIASNQTPVTYSLVLKANTAYNFSSYKIGRKVSLNGMTVYNVARSSSDSLSIADYGSLQLASGTTNITHDDNGAKSIDVSFSIDMESLSYTPGALSGSGKMTLTTIARKSTVSCPTSGTMKSNVVISIGRKSTTAFTHTLKYTFGGTTGDIESELNSDSYTWYVPDLAAKCNNAKSGTCTIICETYSGGDLVGTTTDTMTLNVPAATTPTFSASSVKMGTSVTINTAGNSSNYTHTLSYSFGGASDTIDKGVTTSYKWKVPDLAAKCNNATKGTCTITCKTYNGTALVDTETKDLTLTVQDASTPTLSASTVAMGSNLTIYTNRNSSNFTHKITYSFNGATDELSDDATESCAWKPVPLDLAKKIPKATKGTGKITCVTYNGTAEVGTKTVDFTATVPNNSTTQPLLTKFDITPSGSIPSAFSGLYIQGKTRVEASFSASSEYSDIASYQLGMEGVWLDGNPVTSNVIVGTGRRNVACIVTDARGYSTRVDKSVTAIPYSTPKVVSHSKEKKVICQRCKSDGTLSDSGENLRIKAGRSYYKVIDGETQKNFCTLGYRYKTSAASAYSNDVTLVKSSDLSTDEIDIVVEGVTLNSTQSYDVQVFVIDTMGESDDYTFRIPTYSVDFHLRKGGKGAAFGKYAERKNGVEFEWDVYGRAYGLGKLIPIPEGADINDEKYREFGCYGITLDSIAATIGNLPYPYAGVLRVFSSTGDGNYSDEAGDVYVTQEFTPYTGVGIFHRRITKRGIGEEWQYGDWSSVGGVDAVVESGTSGIWTYRKWFDGTAECWARRNVGVNVTTAWASFYRGTVSALELPFAFKEPPVCNVTVEMGDTDTYFFNGTGGQATTTTAPPILIFRLTSTELVNANVLYSVHGRWK